MCVCVFVCAYCICIYVCIYVSIYMCICVHVCEFVWVLVSNAELTAGSLTHAAQQGKMPMWWQIPKTTQRQPYLCKGNSWKLLTPSNRSHSHKRWPVVSGVKARLAIAMNTVAKKDIIWKSKDNRFTTNFKLYKTSLLPTSIWMCKLDPRCKKDKENTCLWE